MNTNSLPQVSIVIPTFNSAKYIEACLDSIFKQNYPKNKIQVIVVDSQKTTDDTRIIAKKYPVKMLNNPKLLAEPGKTLGYKYCIGDLYLYLDSDARLVSSDWLGNMTRPFLEDQTIVGATTRYLVNPKDNAFNRYMSRSPLQVPPMLDFLLPKFSDLTIENRPGYDVFKVNPKHSPPMGMCVYRKKILTKSSPTRIPLFMWTSLCPFSWPKLALTGLRM